MNGKETVKKVEEIYPLLRHVAIHFFMLGRNNGIESAEHAKEGYRGTPPEWPDYDKEIIKAMLFDKVWEAETCEAVG